MGTDMLLLLVLLLLILTLSPTDDGTDGGVDVVDSKDVGTVEGCSDKESRRS